MRITDTAPKLLKPTSAVLLNRVTDLPLNRDISTLSKLLDMFPPRLPPTKLHIRGTLNHNNLRDMSRLHRHGDKDHNNLNKDIDLLLNPIMVLLATNRISMVVHNNLILHLIMVVRPLIALLLV
jgi:hypothetical protein